MQGTLSISGFIPKGGGGGGGGSLTTANNGLSVSGTAVQLGQSIGAAGNPAALLQNTEIPFNGFQLNFNGQNPPDAFGDFNVGGVSTFYYAVIPDPNGQSALYAINQGKADTSGGNVVEIGLTATATNNKETGANNQINIGIITSAYSADVNWSLVTNNGNVLIDPGNLNGNYSDNGAALQIYDSGSSLGINIASDATASGSKIGFLDLSATYLPGFWGYQGGTMTWGLDYGPATMNVNETGVWNWGSGNGAIYNFRGKNNPYSGSGSDFNIGGNVYIRSNFTADGSLTPYCSIVGANTITVDTTSNAVFVYGASFIGDANKSAGGNQLINVGLTATASGGDVNFSAQFTGSQVLIDPATVSGGNVNNGYALQVYDSGNANDIAVITNGPEVGGTISIIDSTNTFPTGSWIYGAGLMDWGYYTSSFYVTLYSNGQWFWNSQDDSLSGKYNFTASTAPLTNYFDFNIGGTQSVYTGRAGYAFSSTASYVINNDQADTTGGGDAVMIGLQATSANSKSTGTGNQINIGLAASATNGDINFAAQFTGAQVLIDPQSVSSLNVNTGDALQVYGGGIFKFSEPNNYVQVFDPGYILINSDWASSNPAFYFNKVADNSEAGIQCGNFTGEDIYYNFFLSQVSGQQANIIFRQSGAISIINGLSTGVFNVPDYGQQLQVTGEIYATETYKSGNPVTGSAGVWKFGQVDNNAAVPTKRIKINVDAIDYWIPAQVA